MIERWKIRREINRSIEQIRGAVENITAARRTRRYDKTRNLTLTQTEGAVLLGPKVAAVLIFQNADIPVSVQTTLSQLKDAGFSPLVISNAPLTQPARTTLAQMAWRIIERPNLGYDFGGYREAVLHLRDAGITPQKLILMNDSVWTVPHLFTAFLNNAETKPDDLVGNVMRLKKGKTWIESYFYLIAGDTVSSPAFQAFWQNYRLINSKYVVIRKGERDFSVQMAAAGMTLGCIATNEDFITRLDDLSDDHLYAGLAYANRYDPSATKRLTATLALPRDAANWRAKIVACYVGLLHDGGKWNSMFPLLAQNSFGSPFIKKSLDPVNSGWREEILKASRDGLLPIFSDDLLTELEARQMAGTTDRPHWMTRRG